MFGITNNNRALKEETLKILQALAQDYSKQEDGLVKAEYLLAISDMYVADIINISFNRTGEPVVSLTVQGEQLSGNMLRPPPELVN